MLMLSGKLSKGGADACGIGFDSQIALGVAGLLALNLVYLFLAPKP